MYVVLNIRLSGGLLMELFMKIEFHVLVPTLKCKQAITLCSSFTTYSFTRARSASGLSWSKNWAMVVFWCRGGQCCRKYCSRSGILHTGTGGAPDVSGPPA